MSEKLPEYVFHQYDHLFDKMDGAYFGEAEIVGILHGVKIDGTYPGADYVYRYIQCLQIRLREEKEKVLHQKRKRCLDKAEICRQALIRLNPIMHGWNFYSRWHKRWLELAEKFKPNNSTAQ